MEGFCFSLYPQAFNLVIENLPAVINIPEVFQHDIYIGIEDKICSVGNNYSQGNCHKLWETGNRELCRQV